MRFRPARPFRVRAVERESGDALVLAGPAPRRTVVVDVQHQWARVRGQRVRDGVLELHGELRLADPAKLELEIAREGAVLGRHPVELAGSGPGRTFSVRLPLDDLAEAMR